MLDIMPIPLTKGLFALVDGKNYESLVQWKWHTQYHKRAKVCYASRVIRNPKTNKRETITMQRGVPLLFILATHLFSFL